MSLSSSCSPSRPLHYFYLSCISFTFFCLLVLVENKQNKQKHELLQERWRQKYRSVWSFLVSSLSSDSVCPHHSSSSLSIQSVRRPKLTWSSWLTAPGVSAMTTSWRSSASCTAPPELWTGSAQTAHRYHRREGRVSSFFLGLFCILDTLCLPALPPHCLIGRLLTGRDRAEIPENRHWTTRDRDVEVYLLHG